MKKTIPVLIAATMVALPLFSKVKLPSVIGTGMVLQRETNVNLWGWSEKGRTVTVKASWMNKKIRTESGSDGRWSCRVPTTKAGGPYTITFSDGVGPDVTVSDVLMGEVWICGGQSNMEMPVGGFMCQRVDGSMEAVADAGKYPGIRMFTVPRCSSDTPRQDCDTAWCYSTPLNVRTFSAIAYFFARELNRHIGVPIGIVTSNWGGSCIETWLDKASLDSSGRMKAIDDRPNENASSHLYNGMICPIKGFTAKGFVWYQGESNIGNWFDYAALQKALVRLWRKDWGNNEMPFYITQIAPFAYGAPQKRSAALLMEQQWKAADELEHCDVACTTDIGSYELIHPARKQEAAQRLAYLALVNDYGMEGLPSVYPRFKSFEKRADGHLVLSFNHMTFPNNFAVSDPEQQNSFDCSIEPRGFEVAGANHKFYPAKARHIWYTNTIEVWSDSVPDPVAVRYAFRNWPEATVRTLTDLPLPPFRSDNWDITASEF